MTFYKRKHTPETRAKMAAAHRGRRHSHETIIKMSLTRREKVKKEHSK